MSSLTATLIRRELTVLLWEALDHKRSLADIQGQLDVSVTADGLIINGAHLEVEPRHFNDSAYGFGQRYLGPTVSQIVWQQLIAQTPPEVLNYWTA